jgi:hypothetical protein
MTINADHVLESTAIPCAMLFRVDEPALTGSGNSYLGAKTVFDNTSSEKKRTRYERNVQILILDE